MRQRVTIPEVRPDELTPRQFEILNERIGGERTKSIRQIAAKLGYGRNIVFCELKKIKASGWHEKQVEVLKSMAGLALGTTFYHLEKGKYEAARDYLKGMNLYRDKLEVSGSIEQKLSDEEITDKAKQVILEVIQEAKSKQGKSLEVKGEVKGEVKEIGCNDTKS